MERLTLVHQPTVKEVMDALNSDPGTIKLTVSDGKQESERVVTVKSVTRRRDEKQIDFTGTCPHVVDGGTQYWDVYVKHFSYDPTTATYEENFFFL